ncbi:hypothetical protein CRYUN_Cryun16bG0100200 [Craigia yunnanensis]
MSGRHEKEKGVNVQVLLRCRPFSEEELRNNAPQVMTCKDYQREVAVSQNITGKHIDRVFTFDKVFGASAQLKDLYDQAVVLIVNETGPNGELPAEAGVIPRAVKQMFDILESQNAEYSEKVTFLELYNEEITDLLAPEEISKVVLEEKQKKQLPLMEDGKGGVIVRGLEEEIVTSTIEIFTLLERRDSKLTRLLRDSLGGRTKTCIIATDSPAVHCLEETVNQKMMKSTLIKDLYGEMERLKAEVYAAREKNGVYIPKERYYQEESERKAMSDQIEQMGVLLENHQKQLEELQDKYIAQVRQCSDLSGKLEMTEKNLNKTSKLLANSEEELKKCCYVLKEKEFIISEQKKAENALAHQACVLRADLEKALKDNASLFLKIGSEDKLNTDNRVVVNNFQVELAQQIGSLCNLVASSVSQQNEHLQSVVKLYSSFTDIHDKAILDMKKKVTAARALHVSHMEAVQNVVRLHTASSNAALDEISTLASSYAHSIKEFLSSEASKAASMFDDLQGTLATYQGEMALFARELRQRFHVSIEKTKDISDYTNGILDKLSEESVRVQNHGVQADEVQMKSIACFQKAYEEQSKSDAEKLIADMTSLVYNHVDARLVDIRESSVAKKHF